MSHRILWPAALALALLTHAPAAAQTFTWDGGGGNGSWTNPANWAPDGAPPPGGGSTVAIILAGVTQTATTQDRGNPFRIDREFE